MQLPVSGPSPHPANAGVPYHGPPPNVLVQNALPLSMHPSPDGLPPGMRPGLPPHAMVGPAPPPFYQPQPPILESRIYDMNKRLQLRAEPTNADQSAHWWDMFVHEFFDDEATLTLQFTLDDSTDNVPKRYTIGRTLIPRYFRSMFDYGVRDLFYVVRYPTREQQLMHNIWSLECEHFLMVTKYDAPVGGCVEVSTEGYLKCDFTCEDPNMLPRIRHWIMVIHKYNEFVPRPIIASMQPNCHDQLSANLTRQGMSSVTLNYLRLCVILEPMQQLMSQFKAFNNENNKLSPRECLRLTLFARHKSMQQAAHNAQQRAPPMVQPMMIAAETEPPRQPPKRKRNRKGSASGGATPTTGSKKKLSVSPAPASTQFALAPHVDVMVVGEPTLMGGEYGEEDERRISRLENTQYDPSAIAAVALGAAPRASSHTPPGAVPPAARTSIDSAAFDSSLTSWLPGAERRPSSSGTPQTPTSHVGASPMAPSLSSDSAHNNDAPPANTCDSQAPSSAAPNS